MWNKCQIGVILAIVNSIASCPTGFDNIGSTNNNCYMISPEVKTWTSSFTACLSEYDGANLVIIKSEEEFFLVVNSARKSGADVWTGLINSGGVRTWADGTPYNTNLDQFFSNDTGSGIHGYISAADGLFHISDGNVQRSYICYVSMTSPTIPPSATSEPAISPSPPSCEESWFQYANICYWMSEDAENWVTAAHKCRAMSAEFVSIHESEVLTVLLLRADQKTFWIGLMNQNDSYVYEDGSTTDDVQKILGPYTDPWMEGSDCLALDPNQFPLVISHRSCFTQLLYMCYKPASAVKGSLRSI